MNKDCVIAYQFIHGRLSDVTPKADNRFQGRITITPEVRRNLILLLGQELVDNSATTIPANNRVEISNLNESHDDTLASITLEGLKPHGSSVIVDNWARLLEYPQNLIKPPQLIYLVNSKEIIDITTNNSRFNNLQKIAWILNQLKTNSDYQTPQENIFLYRQNVELSSICDESILDHGIQIESLEIILNDEHHQAAKKSLFKSVICEMLGETKKELRLRKLISEFDVFVTRFEIAFHSYVTDYSFDKLRKEFEEKRTEYIQKVNNTFQDIASKLVVLPAPLWLALTQAKSISDKTVIDYIQLYKNITIIILTLVVSLLLFVMICGQFKVLESIKTEYSNLFTRLKTEFPDVKLDEQNELKSLSARHEVVYWQLISTQVVNILLGIFSILIVFQFF